MMCRSAIANTVIAAEVTEPSYFLQRKVGGPASRLINPVSVKRAEAAVEIVLTELFEEVPKLVALLQAQIGVKSNHMPPLMLQTARDLRKLAGAVNNLSLGQAANLMCLYLHGADAAFQPDRQLIATIATMIALAMKSGVDDDPLVEQLLGDSLLAISIQRQREGREPIPDALGTCCK